MTVTIEEEKRSLWLSHIKGWEESGKSQKVYCRTHGLAVSTFGYWRRKLSESAGSAEAAFVEVPRPKSISGEVVLEIRGQISIRVTRDTDQELLLTTLRTVTRL